MEVNASLMGGPTATDADSQSASLSDYMENEPGDNNLENQDADGGSMEIDDANLEENSNLELCSEDVSETELPMTNNVPMEPSNMSTQESLPEEFCHCYCKKERNFNTCELHCATCQKWFHFDCLEMKLQKCIAFMTNYHFLCKNCSSTNQETFSKKQSNFTQMSLTAIANLIQTSISEGSPRNFFSKDKEIIPFIEKNWDSLTTMPKRVKNTWHTTVLKSLTKENEIFTSDSDNLTEPHFFGLANQDLHKVGPFYEGLVKAGIARNIDSSITSGFGKGGRNAKRKFPVDGQSSTYGKKSKSDLVMPKLPAHGYPLEHPFNKDGYRYILAEPDPHAPFRQEFDESQDWAGRPIPSWLYRVLSPNSVLLAMHDRAPQLKVSDDRISATNEKGYCMIRATHGVSRGSWYMECTIEDMPEHGTTRLGWCQALGNLQAPLGYDQFSYAWRSRKGTKFHKSHGYHYTEEGYAQGDVIGFYIDLPHDKDVIALPQVHKEKPLVKFKSYLYFEEKDEPAKVAKTLKPHVGSKIIFYKNGRNMGEAFTDINRGTYYPALSIFKGAKVSVNFGPNFKHPPKDLEFEAMHEMAHQSCVEQVAADICYFVVNKGKLTLDL